MNIVSIWKPLEMPFKVIEIGQNHDEQSDD